MGTAYQLIVLAQRFPKIEMAGEGGDQPVFHQDLHLLHALDSTKSIDNAIDGQNLR